MERAVGKSLESIGFVERIGAIAVRTGSESGAMEVIAACPVIVV